MKFNWVKGTYEGEAVILEWDRRQPSVWVLPEGWKRGIQIGIDEIVNPEDRSHAP